MRWRLAAALLQGASLAAIPAPARPQEDPPCRVEVSIEPERAWVGQQVLFRARMLRREPVREVRWLRALSFPSLRSEWLPGRTPDPRIADVGDAYVVSEDRRALFPVRPGAIEIPPGRVGCRVAGGEREVAVPGAMLLAIALPEPGRPPDFAGVVGPVEVHAYLSREVLELGEALRLAVTVTGEANLWAAAPPLDPALPQVDVYPREPELLLDPGDRLRARRTFVWDLVPHRAGRLELPAPRVPWFDPATGRYAVASGPRLAAEVRERAVTPAPAASPARRSGEGAPRAPWPFVLLGIAGLGALVLGATSRLLGRRAPLRAAAPALADAEQALAAGDHGTAARALAAALRAGLGLRVPGAGALAAEELAARARGRPAIDDAAALLAVLDRARFASASTSPQLPSLDRVRAVLRAIGTTRGSA